MGDGTIGEADLETDRGTEWTRAPQEIEASHSSVVVIPESLARGCNIDARPNSAVIVYPDGHPEIAAEMIDAHTRGQKPLRWAIGQIFKNPL